MTSGLGIGAEIVDGEQARVGAAPAAGGAVAHLQGVEFVHVEQRAEHLSTAGGAARLGGTVTREQAGAIGAHEPRDIGTHGVVAGEVLEGTQHGIVQEGAALHDDLVAYLVRVADLDDLEEGVLDHGVREARADVADRRALLLRLLDARVHEHRAAAA